LGLPDGVMPDEARQDPIYFRTHGSQLGRDGARVPLPWSNESAPFGFTSGTPWLPMQDSWKDLTIEKQSIDPKSSLNIYRNALGLRKEYLEATGGITWLEHGSNNPLLLAYNRGNLSIYMNLGESAVEVEITGKVLIVSTGIPDGRDGKIMIPPISTLWILH
jgi:alpha-glucosidase